MVNGPKFQLKEKLIPKDGIPTTIEFEAILARSKCQLFGLQ